MSFGQFSSRLLFHISFPFTLLNPRLLLAGMNVRDLSRNAGDEFHIRRRFGAPNVLFTFGKPF